MKKANKDKYLPLLNQDKQYDIEKEVSTYIQNAFSFVVFNVDDKERRLDLESKIISTISLCNDCKPSEKWLGLSSPKQKIRESGLWLVNELYKIPLNENEITELIKCAFN